MVTGADSDRTIGIRTDVTRDRRAHRSRGATRDRWATGPAAGESCWFVYRPPRPHRCPRRRPTGRPVPTFRTGPGVRSPASGSGRVNPSRAITVEAPVAPLLSNGDDHELGVAGSGSPDVPVEPGEQQPRSIRGPCRTRSRWPASDPAPRQRASVLARPDQVDVAAASIASNATHPFVPVSAFGVFGTAGATRPSVAVEAGDGRHRSSDHHSGRHDRDHAPTAAPGGPALELAEVRRRRTAGEGVDGFADVGELRHGFPLRPAGRRAPPDPWTVAP